MRQPEQKFKVFWGERQDTCTGVGPVEEKLALGSVLEDKSKGNKEKDREKEGGEEQEKGVEGGDVKEGGQEKQRKHFSWTLTF